MTEVIDLAAIERQQEIGNCQVRIVTENKFRAEHFLVRVPGRKAIKMCHIGWDEYLLYTLLALNAFTKINSLDNDIKAIIDFSFRPAV
jgi:hypothetical protein